MLSWVELETKIIENRIEFYSRTKKSDIWTVLVYFSITVFLGYSVYKQHDLLNSFLCGINLAGLIYFLGSYFSNKFDLKLSKEHLNRLRECELIQNSANEIKMLKDHIRLLEKAINEHSAENTPQESVSPEAEKS